MPCYVGLDASKRHTSVCVTDPNGNVLREGRVETTPKAIVGFLRGDGARFARIGIESSSLAPWIYEGLARARLPIICIEARHAHGALGTQPNKTDRSDARGIADLMRTGSYRAVHIKTLESRRIRAMLTARKLLKAKAQDIQNGIRGLLLGLGFKFESGRTATFDRRVRTAVSKHEFASTIVAPLLELRSKILTEVAHFERRLGDIARHDPVCTLLQTAPGVGPLTALIYRTSVDEPGRFASSRAVGPHLGLVPQTHQSGDIEWRGRISKHGDRDARSALFMAAMVLLTHRGATSWLRRWGEAVAARRGRKRAIIAVARRLAVVLHKMWLTESPFRPEVLVR
jgi:transposase